MVIGRTKCKCSAVKRKHDNLWLLFWKTRTQFVGRESNKLISWSWKLSGSKFITLPAMQSVSLWLWADSREEECTLVQTNWNRNQSAIDQQKENIGKCNHMQVDWLTSIYELNKWQIYLNIEQLILKFFQAQPKSQNVHAFKNKFTPFLSSLFSLYHWRTHVYIKYIVCTMQYCGARRN